MAEVLPKEQGDQAPDRAPSLKVTWKISHQKAIGACFQESQRAIGNKDSIFKGHTQNHTHPGPRV